MEVSTFCLLTYFCVQNTSWFGESVGKSTFSIPFMPIEGIINDVSMSGTASCQHNIFVAWTSLLIYNGFHTKSLQAIMYRVIHCICIGCFEVCFMVLPLLWSSAVEGSQSGPVNWYKCFVFINQAVVYGSIAAWIYEDIHYHLTDNVVPFWMTIGRPLINYWIPRPTEERIIQYFDPQGEKEHAFIKQLISDYYHSSVPPKTTTIWYFATQRAMHFTTYQKVNAYYEKHEQSLVHKKFNLVVILGLPRSGTTFTQHELMRRNPEWKGMRVCDLLYPLDKAKVRKAWFGIYVYKLLWGGFFKHLDLSHPYEHDDYEEETLLFRGSMRWMPTDDCNPHAEDAYIYLMKLLKLFFQDGDTVILKSPYHALYPKLVKKYFSDGKVIVLERDFNKVRPSWEKLMLTANRLDDPYAEYPYEQYKDSIIKRCSKQLEAMKQGTKELLGTHPSARRFKSDELFANSPKVFNDMMTFVNSE